MKERLRDYNLTAGIHTISIKTEDEFVLTPEMSHVAKGHNTDMTTVRINVNKPNGFLTSFAEYNKALNRVLIDAGICSYKLIRVDMCFDNYDEEHYQKYAKLNRLLISMIAQAYSVRNKYKTSDLFTNKQLSVAIKNPNSFEVENYDKAYESGRKDFAKSRFEIRSVRMNGRSIESEFIDSWDMRFDKALTCFDETLKRYNSELIKIYLSEKNHGNELKWPTFFQMYENCIFTKNQALELLMMMGEKNPSERYKYFKRSYKLQIYDKDDVCEIVSEIRRARTAFFAGEKNSLNEENGMKKTA